MWRWIGQKQCLNLSQSSSANDQRQSLRWPSMNPIPWYSHPCVEPFHIVPGLVHAWPIAYSRNDSKVLPGLRYTKTVASISLLCALSLSLWSLSLGEASCHAVNSFRRSSHGKELKPRTTASGALRPTTDYVSQLGSRVLRCKSWDDFNLTRDSEPEHPS